MDIFSDILVVLCINACIAVRKLNDNVPLGSKVLIVFNFLYNYLDKHMKDFLNEILIVCLFLNLSEKDYCDACCYSNFP